MSGECERSILRLISFTGQTIRCRADQWLKKHDLTVEQLQVLKVMTLATGQTQRSLCVATEKSPANITRILDRLEKRKMVVRRPNPEDRRSSLVFLTEEGSVVRDDVVQKLTGLSERLLDGIDAREQQVVYTILERILDNIEKIS